MADNSRKCYERWGIQYARVSSILPESNLMGWASEMGALSHARALEQGLSGAEALEWAKAHWRDRSQDAMDLGTQVHQAIEDSISGRPVTTGSPEAQVALDAWREWSDANVEKYLNTELTVIHHEWGYGGTIDAVARMKDGRNVILDWKTSKAIYDNYPIQANFYRLAGEVDPIIVNNDFRTHIHGAMIVRLPKDSIDKLETKEVAYGDRERELVWALTVAYFASKKRRLKGNPMVAKFWGESNG